MLSIEAFLDERFPGFTQRRPLLGKTLLRFLRFLCHEREFKQFEEHYPHLEGFDFVDQVLDYFEFSYRVKANEIERIPTHGRVVIVANHPIGSLDGLALLKMVGEIRPDVKVVANEVLNALKPLQSLLLPVDNMTGRSGKDQLLAIHQHLGDDGALIMFPAGEVSRMSPSGIRDGRWNNGFLRFATRHNAPVLPICVDGRNSIFFYSLSFFAKPVSTLWLIREMFKQAKNHVDINVGHMVYPDQYQGLGLKPDAVAKLFKKHVYSLTRKNRRSVGFIPEAEAIAHPENRQRLKQEIKRCSRLGVTPDGKEIYLYRYETNSVIMREIGRLRELTFRAVKEGTGRRRDMDVFDQYYDHVILWDDQELEIAGAYRMARAAEALARHPEGEALYTQTLFDYSEAFEHYMHQGLELGRSFVQPRFWGKRSLDYLWQGIGAYLNYYPDLRYLFGPVSISHDYPEQAKNLLICFYSVYFGADGNLATAKNPYLIHAEDSLELAEMFSGSDYSHDFRVLKRLLSDSGHSVPTLYKQYTELCCPGGAQFIAFNVDREFADCIDGLILVDLESIKTDKRSRYLGQG